MPAAPASRDSRMTPSRVLADKVLKDSFFEYLAVFLDASGSFSSETLLGKSQTTHR